MNNSYIYRKYFVLYIHQLKSWPSFTWDADAILPDLGKVRHRQGLILGQMNSLGFRLKEDTILETLTLDVIKSSEIEGEKLSSDQVRSSIACRLGIDIAGAVPASRDVEGVVEMLLDANQQYKRPLTDERLYDWHSALFPTGRAGMHKITVGAWRTPDAGPMQVVSGAIGKEKVHFEAPDAARLDTEMKLFIHWFNNNHDNDPVIKAAIAHLWFVTIHPFDDGNGRIARALTDLLLARADDTSQRFYSMSAQILNEKAAYYHLLESTQKGGLDITSWINWFLACLYRAMDHTEDVLSRIFTRNSFWEQNRDVVLNSRQHQIISILLDDFYGKLTTNKWSKMAKCSVDTALRDIQDLVDKGILAKGEGGSRNTSYALLLPQKK